MGYLFHPIYSYNKLFALPDFPIIDLKHIYYNDEGNLATLI